MAGAAHAASDSHVYYPYFDYLRIFLAVGVFATHADRADIIPKPFGTLCVQVFFALSGFLIGSILLRSTTKSLPRFFFNRATRIWIPYLIGIAILLAGTVAKGQKLDLKLFEFFFYKLTFVYNLFSPAQLHLKDRMPLQGTGNHFWSLCVEEQFYLFAPFLLVLLPRARVPVLVALYLVNFAYEHSFAAVTLGVLLAISARNYGEWYVRTPITALLGVVLVASLWGSFFTGTPDHFLFPIASVATVALLARKGGDSPFAKLLGGISYPFYLNHWIGLVLRKSLERLLGLGSLLGTLVAFAISFGFGLGHYLFVDRKIMQTRGGWYTPEVGKWCCITGIGLIVLGVLGHLVFRVLAPV